MKYNLTEDIFQTGAKIQIFFLSNRIKIQENSL